MKTSNSSYPPELSNQRLKEIELEVYENTKTYLKNCSDNYLEYVTAAQKIFPETYEKVELFDKIFDMGEHLSLLEKATKNNNVELQVELLKKGVENNIYAPATYDRLAQIYEKRNEFESAYKTCIKWFETDYWKLPNTSKGSLRILKRPVRLEKKYGA